MDQISNSFGSRRSSGNNFARFAFNIYGGNNSGNSNSSPQHSSSSNPYQILANSTSSSSNSSYSRINHQFQNYNTSEHNELDNSLRYFSSSEILTFDNSKINSSLVAIGGQRLFQLLRVEDETNEIVMDIDMYNGTQSARSNKTSAISDLKFGYNQYCNFIATAAISGNIQLYNLAKSNKVISTLSDHSRAVNTIDFNPNPNQSLNHSLLSGSQDGTIKLWDLRTKNTKAVMTLQGSSDAVRGVQFSPHVAKKIVGIFDSGVIKKYDLRNPNQAERKLNAHTGPGLSIDWHPELDYVASGGRDKQIQVWNMSSASNDSRVPDFVINASGAVAKVKWSPHPCNGNILDSKMATCFFGDDPCVQVWSLNRKYIPDYIVESHFNQVTGILWKDQDFLWSGSKDKTFIQHDLRKNSKFISSLSVCGLDWSNSNTELSFVLQSKDSFKNNTQLHIPSISTTNSEINLTSQSPSAASLSFTPLMSSPLQSYDRPTLNRNATHRPPLMRNPSNQQQQQVQNSNKVTPYVCPVNLPVPDNDPRVFEFLSSNYLTTVPEGMDFTSVCEYNSMIAASAKRLRESQTWKVIKSSIVWQYEQGIDYKDFKSYRKNTMKSETFRSFKSITNSRTNSELDIGSLGSHSTGNFYGVSPVMSHFPRSADFTPPDRFIKEIEQEPVVEETEKDLESLRIDEHEEEETDEQEQKEESVTETSDEASKPIPIKSPLKKRLSFNGYPNETVPYTFSGSIPDYDDETKEYQSSPGRSPMSLKSSLSSHRHESFSKNTWKLVAENKLTPLHRSSRSDSKSMKSGKSGLSRVLQEHLMDSNEEAIADDDDEEDDEKEEKELTKEKLLQTEELVSPWSPQLLIKEAAEYYAEQGNIIMCATLAMLFLEYFKGHSITRYQAMDWIYSYHEILHRKLLFSNAADILKNSSIDYPVMKQKGQTETSLRFYCSNCQELIVNEPSKQKHQEDNEVDFGYWYCDNCKKTNGRCCYCNELMKGLAISSLPCGHIAHFGCFKSWFFDEEEKCCPACAYPVI